jgi:hypothetical protein
LDIQLHTAAQDSPSATEVSHAAGTKSLHLWLQWLHAFPGLVHTPVSHGSSRYDGAGSSSLRGMCGTPFCKVPISHATCPHDGFSSWWARGARRLGSLCRPLPFLLPKLVMSPRREDKLVNAFLNRGKGQYAVGSQSCSTLDAGRSAYKVVQV